MFILILWEANSQVLKKIPHCINECLNSLNRSRHTLLVLLPPACSHRSLIHSSIHLLTPQRGLGFLPSWRLSYLQGEAENNQVKKPKKLPIMVSAMNIINWAVWQSRTGNSSSQGTLQLELGGWTQKKNLGRSWRHRSIRSHSTWTAKTLVCLNSKDPVRFGQTSPSLSLLISHDWVPGNRSPSLQTKCGFIPTPQTWLAAPILLCGIPIQPCILIPMCSSPQQICTSQEAERLVLDWHIGD